MRRPVFAAPIAARRGPAPVPPPRRAPAQRAAIAARACLHPHSCRAPCTAPPNVIINYTCPPYRRRRPRLRGARTGSPARGLPQASAPPGCGIEPHGALAARGRALPAQPPSAFSPLATGPAAARVPGLAPRRGPRLETPARCPFPSTAPHPSQAWRRAAGQAWGRRVRLAQNRNPHPPQTCRLPCMTRGAGSARPAPPAGRARGGRPHAVRRPARPVPPAPRPKLRPPPVLGPGPPCRPHLTRPAVGPRPQQRPHPRSSGWVIAEGASQAWLDGARAPAQGGGRVGGQQPGSARPIAAPPRQSAPTAATPLTSREALRTPKPPARCYYSASTSR
jgi:hypothetical protein